MSSTNRGGQRHASDYYVTPEQDIKMFLSEFLLIEKIDRPDRLKFLDPCAGGRIVDGEIVDEMSYAKVLTEEFDPFLTTMDIREDSPAQQQRDFLNNPPIGQDFDIAISNPPFSHAPQFIKTALNCVKEGGFVIMLLRLNFFGSDARKVFFKEIGHAKHVFIHPDRISFTPDNKADSIEYAHFVWQKGVFCEFSQARILEGFSKSERAKFRGVKKEIQRLL